MLFYEDQTEKEERIFVTTTEGEKIKTKRKSLGYSQLYISYAIGMSEGWISRVESGNVRVKAKPLTRFLKEISCAASTELLEREKYHVSC
jgi:transcriptional regulator with XRE-family HTH domain